MVYALIFILVIVGWIVEKGQGDCIRCLRDQVEKVERENLQLAHGIVTAKRLAAEAVCSARKFEGELTAATRELRSEEKARETACGDLDAKIETFGQNLLTLKANPPKIERVQRPRNWSQTKAAIEAGMIDPETNNG
jgi:hypothetical protein